MEYKGTVLIPIMVKKSPKLKKTVGVLNMMLLKNTSIACHLMKRLS